MSLIDDAKQKTPTGASHRTNRGWWHRLNDKDPQMFAELRELVAAFEDSAHPDHDAIRARFSSRPRLLAGMIRPELEKHGIDLLESAFEAFCRRVARREPLTPEDRTHG